MFYASPTSRLLAIFVGLVCGWVQLAPAVAQDADRRPFLDEVDARAIATPNGVLIEWASTFRSDVLGFNVYRNSGEAFSRINSSLIAGPTLITSASSPAYAWLDTHGTSASKY